MQKTAALPPVFDKEPVAPRAASKASSILSNPFNSSCLPSPWLSSVSSPSQCNCRDCSSQCPSGQEMMPISLLKPTQLDVINFLLVFPLRTDSFKCSLLSGKKLKKGSNSICFGSVGVCVCRQGKKAARPMALLVFKWTVPSNTDYLFGRSILIFVITEKVAHILGRSKNTLGR